MPICELQWNLKKTVRLSRSPIHTFLKGLEGVRDFFSHTGSSNAVQTSQTKSMSEKSRTTQQISLSTEAASIKWTRNIC